MTDLAAETCEPCRGGAPKVEGEELDRLRREVPDWTVREVDGVQRLERVFEFPDFASALAFADRVGEIAEGAGHHPAILVEWGRCTVGWWTHAIRGLHRNDFRMAARTDKIR